MRAVAIPLVLLLAAGCGTTTGADAQWDAPPAGATVDYQLGGSYTPDPAVEVVVRDRTAAAPASRYGICYVNAFQTQPDELTAWQRSHPDLLLHDGEGQLVEDPSWPGEYLLDIRTEASRSRLLTAVGPWIDGCAEAGYQAVEPDNLDSWTRSEGLLDRDDAAALARLLIDRAHASGLAIAQKNAPELSRADLGFDFAVAEECEVYRECDAYTDAFGDNVIEIEYTDNGTEAFTRACATRGDRVSVLLRDRDAVAPDDPAHVARWC